MTAEKLQKKRIDGEERGFERLTIRDTAFGVFAMIVDERVAEGSS